MKGISSADRQKYIDSVLTKEFLTQKVTKERKLRKDLVKETGISSSSIQKRLNRFGLKTNCDYEDLTGKIFGNLLVISRLKENQFSNVVWVCQCDCGKIVNVLGGNLRNSRNNTRSCGCINHRKQSDSSAWKGYEKISVSHKN